jgi:RNA polymerase sigma factor (sigma-70 family)
MELQEYNTRNNFSIRLEARLKNDELAKARESLGLTIKDAAENIGISPGTLGSFENLKAYPREYSQKKICEFYRKNGYFILEEDVFPKELRQVKARKLIVEKEIPKEKIVSLSYVSKKLLPINYITPRDELNKKILNEELINTIRSLPKRYQLVLEYRFGLNGKKQLPLDEIAKKFIVTRERIRQIEARALKILRHPSRSRRLLEYFKSKY